MRLFVLALTLLAQGVAAYVVNLDAASNRIGELIFNSSLGHGWTYSLDSNRTPKHVRRLITVGHLDGQVRLKRTLTCDEAQPNPMVFYVECRSFRLGGSTTEYVGIPVIVKFCTGKLPHHVRHASTLVAVSVVEHAQKTKLPQNEVEELSCHERSQWILNVKRLLPGSVSRCQVTYDSPSDPKYALEPRGGDLVARKDFCVPYGQWLVQVPFTLHCGERPPYQQSLELLFHLPNVNADMTSEGSPKSRRRRRGRREMRNLPPYFDRAVFVVTVPEEKEKGHVVTTINAKDPNNDELRYSLHAVLDSRSQSMFTIDPHTGLVTTAAVLDREFMDVHYLRVTAVDDGSPPKSGTTTLQVNVADENDHTPSFERATYETSVRESVSIGTTILTVRATDQDSGGNAEVEYSIMNPSGSNDAFRIDPKSGILTTRSFLDRETTPFYSLLIQATDMGPVADRRLATTTVEVTVLDDNDNYPQFTERSYTATIPEDINWLSNPVVATVKAYDDDSGINAAVRYSLIGGNTQGHFVMDSLTGEITLVKPLDYETARSYRLVVRAQDGGSPSRSNTTQVLVKVTDVNDNDPKFYTSLFQESVMENVPVGQSIVRVQAYDSDDGPNSEVTYSIETKHPDMPLDVDRETGWIVTTRELDREQGSLYDFSVVASDRGTPSRSATASVIIRVQDLNDNDPVFEPKIYEASISEVDPPGTPVVSVTATDKDENPRLVYHLTNGNVRGRFGIISQNGQGLLSVAQPLDFKLEKRFVVTVTATDAGGRFDTATVYVNVTDANTHRPAFERTPYATSVPEDAAVGTTVLVVEAIDGDVGENARLVYTMDEVPEFRMDPVTGAIVTARPLDREATAGYTIVVTAQDNGNPPLSDTTNVEVEVSDVNDNPPEFQAASYTSAVSEDSLVGTSVVQVVASDKDLGLNGQIRYTFSGGDDGGGAFSVDPTSGVIRTNRMLDREAMPIYNLLVYAVDRGSPALSSSVSVVVYVEDINDNPPRFESDKIKLFVPENSPIGWTVGEVKAYDPDEGPNAEVQYSIVGGPDADAFSLISRPGEPAELTTRVDLDYESPKKKYGVIVRASSPPLRNDVDVEILVTDVNDNAPLLKDFTILFNNYKNYFPVGSVGRVPAFDADVTDNLRFRFVSGNNANLLLLNETSGEVTLSPSLNTNVPINAVMEVSVFDGINEVLAHCQLIVRLVTESMLFNSVTVRLNDMTQTEFLSPLFEYFVEGLSAIIPCPKENIFVFNVQDDTDVEARILNVSFSARRQGSRDPEEFYSPQFLQERVYLNRAILAKLTNVQVLPFDDNLCVREPCVNFEECLSVLKFGNASGFISSDSLLFRPIYPVNTFACRCPLGFTGMNHKYECDTEVNLCYSSPCGSNGTCLRREGGYACVCKEGFVGRNCEVNLWENHCPVRMCQGGSKCSLLQDSNGFFCDNCTNASWSTKLCELRARSFSRGTFLTFPSLKQRYRLHLKMRFATRERNALLLYNGRYNEKHDFISLEIIDSQMVFSFSLGVNVTKVTAIVDGGVSDGQWHQVEISYLNRTVTLSVDNCDSSLAIKYKRQLPNYTCANSITFTLEQRCADLMQTCYRFLDLTGPLQIGGLPALMTEFQVKHQNFVGCIMDLEIDHQLLDLNSFVADNGTVSGCPEKRGFCQSSPCKNGGICEEGWGSFICRCSVGFGGDDCSEGIEPAKHFSGNGFLILTPHLRPVQMPWINSLAFRTRQATGLLVNIQLGQSSYALLEMKDGFLQYHFDEQMMGMYDVKVDDGKWHHIQAKWMGNEVWMTLDHGQYEVTKQMEGNIRGLYVGKVSIGGLEPTDTEEASLGFSGCIQDVQIGDTHSRESWLRPSVESNVKDGCHVVNSCLNSPCPENSQCIDLWGAYKCQCNPGFLGEQCLPICELQPCENDAICRRLDAQSDALKRGYSCDCDSLHSGEYCEVSVDQPCPSNWWGYPICGPCNCPINKGYDADCNKTTGECVCEENHFQPLDSDICFDCDCYATGSFSNKCDPITGQCRCRIGVIGRRCDACSSPFAEVTLRGCEVIYDGCPRSFEEGIWWDRTLFDHEAVHPCPRDAIGKAFRFCDKDGGWGTANLFNCTSEALLELTSQLSIMEKNNLPLNTYSAVKITTDLHTALESIDHLYGSDVLVISQFLHYVLMYETKQDGLNLTHRQDRDFIQNIVDISSKILETQYDRHWEKIVSLTARGPEYLMLLFEKYGATLARNQGDTYTDPFEVTAKNMIFGMDTVSSNEMWMYRSDRSSNASVAVAEPSDFLDASLPKSDGPGVMIPKYNNFPVRKLLADDATRIIFPLSNLEVGGGRGVTAHFQESREHAIVAYAIYRTIGKLLPPLYDATIRHRFGIPVEVNSPVVNLVAQPVNSSQPLSGQLPHSFRVHFQILQTRTHTSPQCSYWDYTAGARGKWSTEGCEIQGSDFRSGHGTYVNCTCNHLTSFALLMDATDKDYLVEESLAQDIVSYLGIVVSLVMLGLAFVALSILRGLQTNSNTIHKNLIACIFLAQLVFLVALKTRNTLVKQEFPCKVVAIVLHYFFLCIFSWMLLEGIHLYRMLTEMRDVNHGQMRFYYSIGYGASAIVVGLSVGVRADQYGNYYFCWLSVYESVVWSLVGPICFVVVINLGVFAMAMRASIQIKGSVTDFGNLRTLLWLAIILLPLLGTTWVLAVLSVNESLEVLHFSFSISCMIEGIYIFVGYCIVNKKVRQQLSATWARLRGRKLPYDESLSGTRTTVASRSALAYNNSSFDVLHRNVGISTSSTTSRSTKTSSSPYRSDSHLRNTSTSTSAQLNSGSDVKSCTRRRKAYLYRSQNRSKGHVEDPDTGEANQKKKGETDSDSEMSIDHASLDLASSHSSDDEEYEEGWKQKKLNTKREITSKPNIVEEAENSQAQLVQSYNVPPSTMPNLRVNIAPYPQYTGLWSVPPKPNTFSYLRDGPLKSLGLKAREDPKRSDLSSAANHRNLPDISLPLQSRFSPPLIDNSPSPEQKLPVPERADSLPNNLNSGASQSQQQQDDARATQLSTQVMEQCMVIPPLTTTELSSESEQSNETSV